MNGNNVARMLVSVVLRCVLIYSGLSLLNPMPTTGMLAAIIGTLLILAAGMLKITVAKD